MNMISPPLVPSAKAGRTATLRTFKTRGGSELFFRHWPALSATRGAIVLFHRGHEHSGRMAHLVDELAMPEFAFYAWDARGHGRSPGERGDAPSFATAVSDVEVFIKTIARRGARAVTRTGMCVVVDRSMSASLARSTDLSLVLSLLLSLGVAVLVHPSRLSAQDGRADEEARALFDAGRAHACRW